MLDVQDTESGGEPSIRVLDVESGKLTQLAGSEGLFEPAEGYIAALNPAKKQVWLYDCKLPKWSAAADANFPSALRWSPGGDALYFQDTNGTLPWITAAAISSI